MNEYNDDPAFYRLAPLQRAIARANFWRQLAGASLDDLKQFVVALAQPENDFVN